MSEIFEMFVNQCHQPEVTHTGKLTLNRHFCKEISKLRTKSTVSFQ